MKKIISCICLLLMVFAASAQTQAEIDKMMKQAQEAMKNLPPEAKKMMDSLGVKIPDPAKYALPKGMTPDNIKEREQQILADDEKYREKSLIEMPKRILTDAELYTFLKLSFNKINAKTSATIKTNAWNIITASKAKNVSIEHSAIAALMAQRTGEALWIMANLVTENLKDANLLCNYAAVVTMCDGPHLAIPVLMYLNNKYPENSTILNNLGQAWYNMEKKDSAEKYLNAAIKRFPYHATANYTESKICLEKKDTIRATALLRNALKYGCGILKIKELEKVIGKKVTKQDIDWSFADDPDPLGFGKITIPEYPMDVQTSELLEPSWRAFISYWKAAAKKYDEKLKDLVAATQQKQQALAAKALQTRDDSNFQLPFADKAAIFYAQAVADGFKLSAKAFANFAQYKEEERELLEEKKEKEKELDALMEKKYEGKCPGEGCPYESYCPDYANRQNDINSSYLSKINPKYDFVLNEQLNAARQVYNANVNMALYTSVSDEQFEFTKVTAKAGYAHALADVSYTYIRETPKDCGLIKDKNGNYVGGMDDMECDDKFSVGFGIGKVSLSCTSFTIEGGELIQGSFEKNFRTGEFEIGFGAGVTTYLGSGPACVEAGFKVMELYHFNREGKLTDAGVKTSAGAEARFGAVVAGKEGSITVMINSGIKTGSERYVGTKF
jgi:hypothetical protein